MSRKFRTLEVVAKNSFFEELDRLSSETSRTRAEILDNAFGLYVLAFDSVKAGGAMKITDKAGKVIASSCYQESPASVVELPEAES
jgi:hypothetical protein